MIELFNVSNNFCQCLTSQVQFFSAWIHCPFGTVDPWIPQLYTYSNTLCPHSMVTLHTSHFNSIVGQSHVLDGRVSSRWDRMVWRFVYWFIMFLIEQVSHVILLEVQTQGLDSFSRTRAKIIHFSFHLLKYGVKPLIWHAIFPISAKLFCRIQKKHLKTSGKVCY